MAVREYEVRGYRNTGYSPGVIESSEFDRPLSQAVFEELYPDADADVIELQEVGSRFLLRSIYKKDKIKVKHTGTQKDIIYQIDYLRIKAINGGDNREVAYYFVDSARTEYVSANTAVLYLTMDEQTTADATQHAKISGIIEKRNIHEDEVDLNWYSEEFNPAEPMDITLAYITAESGTGYTVKSGVAKTAGMLDLAVVYCDLGQALASPAVVAPLPAAADSVTFTIEGSDNDFSVRVDGMALVDTNNALVKQALNKIRELGAEDMIGANYSFPLQCLKEAPTTYTSNGVPLITGIKGGSFGFTVDNLKVVPTYNGMYDQLVNKKAGYQHCTYTIVAPASGDSKTYTLHEIIESTSGADAENLPDKQINFIGTGVPMANGAIYWRPSELTHITPVTGYDRRIVFVESVRGSDWNSDGLMLKGQANAELIAQQLTAAETRKGIDDKQIDKQLELTKQNIAQARFQSTYGMAGTGVSALVQGISGNYGQAFSTLLGAVPELGKYLGANISSDGSFGLLGDTYNRQEKIAAEQAQLAKQSNALGLNSTRFGAEYARRTQSLAVKPPTGADMNRIMGSSLLVIRRTLTPSDVMRYDSELTWTGTTVKEKYVGFLKDHDYLFEAGEDFSYLKLGMCTIQLPGEPSNWANTTAWKTKIQAEMQTGGRYWKKKILDYEWKMPIPVDEGFTPGGSGERVYFESLTADGTPTTTALTVRINKDIPIEDMDFVVSGATYSTITKTGFGEYTIAIDKGSFVNNAVVSVKLNSEGISFNPKSKAAQVIKAWEPSQLGMECVWNSVATPPYILGYGMIAINELSSEEHFILWRLNTDFIITRVYRENHDMYATVDIPDLLVGNQYQQGIVVMNNNVYIAHSSSITDRVNLTDVQTGVTTSITTTGGIGYRTGRSGYGNFLVDTDGSTFVRYYPALARGVSVSSTIPMPVRSSYPIYWFRGVIYSTGPTSRGEDIYTMIQLSEDTHEQLYKLTSEGYSNAHNYGFQLMTEDGHFVGVRDGKAGLLKLDFGTGNVTLIDDSVYTNGTTATHGPVFKQGLYLRRGGDWYFRYNNGEEISVEDAPLAPMMQADYRFQFYTDGNSLFRILG